MYPILQMSEFSTRRPYHRVEQLIPNAIRYSARRMPKYLCSDDATLVVLRLSFSHWWRRPAQAPAWLPRASLRHLFHARARRDDVSDGLASKSIGKSLQLQEAEGSERHGYGSRYRSCKFDNIVVLEDDSCPCSEARNPMLTLWLPRPTSISARSRELYRSRRPETWGSGQGSRFYDLYTWARGGSRNVDNIDYISPRPFTILDGLSITGNTHRTVQ